MHRKSLLSVLAIAALSLLSSCSSSPSKMTLDNRAKECMDRLKRAEQLMTKEDYSEARIRLDKLVDECAGSGITDRAQFLLGEADFNLEDWLSARSDYSIYLGQYPNAEYSSISAYKRGLAAYNLPYKMGRDGKDTKNAIEDFEYFISKFPSSPKVDSAHYYLSELHEREAKNAYAIGRLYLRMGEPQAAVMSFKDFLVFHSDSKLAPTVLKEMIDAYLRLDQYSQARLYLDTLKTKVDSTENTASIATSIDQAENKFNSNIASEEARKNALIKNK